jgi:hypothetical protein
MTELPEPLTPADCDLQDFTFMPVDIIRLFGSRFHAIASDGEWRAGLTLWLKSFHQVPAASIPDDDIELARLAELGRDVKTWRKLREVALYGWVKCADGRLYHPTVAEKALEAWKRKEFYRERSKKANAARWSSDHGDTQREEGTGAGKGKPRDPERVDQGQLVGSEKDAVKQSNGHPSRNASSNPPASQGTVTGTKPPNPPSDHHSMCERIADEAGMLGIPPDHRLLRDWLALPNMEFERDILPVVRRVTVEVKARDGRAPFKFKLFDAAIREQHAADEREIARLREIQVRYAAEATH